MPRPTRETKNENVVDVRFPNVVTLCDSTHRECLALVSTMIETGSHKRQSEVVTLALATAQLAHTQMSLLRLGSRRADETRSALADLCRSTRQAIAAGGTVPGSARLIRLLEVTSESLSR